MKKDQAILVCGFNGREEMEGAGWATGISSRGRNEGQAGSSIVPDPEISEKAVRRRFTAEYKSWTLLGAPKQIVYVLPKSTVLCGENSNY